MTLPPQLRNRMIWIAFLGALSIAAFGLTMSSTRRGPEVNDDSILYVAAAKNILTGNGFSWLSGGGEVRPIAGFPPAYSVAIAATGLTGIDLFEGARWVNAVLFGVSALLVGLLVLQATESGLAALIGTLLVVANADLLFVHRWIMAEALFIALLLLLILVLSGHLHAPRWTRALLSGLIIALALLTRYAGVGLLPGALLALWLLGGTSRRRKLQDSLLMAAVAMGPLVILTVFNQLATGSAYHREAVFEAPQYATLVTYLNEAFSWFVPSVPEASIRLRWKMVLLFTLLVVVPLVLFVKARRVQSEESRASTPRSASIPVVASFLSLAYVAVLAAAISGDDVGGVHLQRYMAPVYVSWVVLTATVVHQVVWNQRGATIVKVGALGLAAFYIGWYGNEGFRFFQDPGSGPGADDYRRDSPGTVTQLQRLDSSEPLYTNEIYLVYYLTYRSAFQVPLLDDMPAPGSPEGAGSPLSVFRRRMADGAYLILFDSIEYQEDMFLSREILTDGLVPAMRITRGKVYVDPNAHAVGP